MRVVDSEELDQEGLQELPWVVEKFKENFLTRDDYLYLSLEESLELFLEQMCSGTKWQVLFYLDGRPVGCVFLGETTNFHYGKVAVELTRWIKYPVIGTGNSRRVVREIARLYQGFLRSTGIPRLLRVYTNGESHTYRLKRSI